MRVVLRWFCLLPMLLLSLQSSVAEENPTGLKIPEVRWTVGGGELLVGGKPFLILGGELGNSAAGTAAQADTILPRVAALHVNTVLMPVAWEQIEPVEGNFDFSILDHWTEVARQQHLHLVLLWFGAWKNGFSNYAPLWVKNDPARFPRALSAQGQPLEILSTLGKETLRSDSRAYATLLQHVRDQDQRAQTVLMVQVENEVGYVGLGGRDRSPEANRLFAAAVPAALLQTLAAQRDQLSPELAAALHPQGRTWAEVFGSAADEVFMAWHYASYIQDVAAAGKKVYPLPMYVNTQLPAPGERAGDYPSGGPHPSFLAVYRIAAPALDFFSPDIYWPDFAYWIGRYVLRGNPVFVPEAKLEPAPFNALYAFGAAHAFGFSAFDIDRLTPPVKPSDPEPMLAQTYAALASLLDVLPAAQQEQRTAAVVLQAGSPRPTEVLALGGYLMRATLSRTWPARTLATEDGAMLVLQSAPDTFLVAGAGLSVSIVRDPDVDSKTAGIASIEEVVPGPGGGWVVERRLNGDQSDQGRQLMLDPHQMRVYRVRLYTY